MSRRFSNLIWTVSMSVNDYSWESKKCKAKAKLIILVKYGKQHKINYACGSDFGYSDNKDKNK